jgi:hypothetical protein
LDALDSLIGIISSKGDSFLSGSRLKKDTTEVLSNLFAETTSMEIIESVITTEKGWCEDCGVFQHTMGVTGEKVLARYTIIYVWEDGVWVIANHHSSPMPEPMLNQKVDQDEKRAKEEMVATPPDQDVAKMFDLWNQALASTDAAKVAALYHPNALLSPTISDVPRKTYNDIQAYYEIFLQQEPQAFIRFDKSHHWYKRNILTGHHE